MFAHKMLTTKYEMSMKKQVIQRVLQPEVDRKISTGQMYIQTYAAVLERS